MLHLPVAWPTWAVWGLFACLLAGLDVAMGSLATLAVQSRTSATTGACVAGGLASAAALFWVLWSSLAYGDLFEMNLLWIVMLLVVVPFAQWGLTGTALTGRAQVGTAVVVLGAVLVLWPSTPRDGATPDAAVLLTPAPDRSAPSSTSSQLPVGPPIGRTPGTASRSTSAPTVATTVGNGSITPIGAAAPAAGARTTGPAAGRGTAR